MVWVCVGRGRCREGSVVIGSWKTLWKLSAVDLNEVKDQAIWVFGEKSEILKF